PGDVAALEAAIEYAGVALGLRRGFEHPGGELRCRRTAPAGADVEVRQASGEEARHLGPDGVGVEQNGEAESLAQARELGRQPVVVRTPVALPARRDLRRVGRR